MLGRIAALAILMLPARVLAHHPMGGTVPGTLTEGLLSGLGHPLIGVDHFFFIVAAGVLAAKFERGYVLPLMFVFASVFSTLVRYLGVDADPGEIPVAATLLVLGAMMLAATTPRHALIAVLFLFAGAIHGHALGEAIVGAEQTPLAAYLTGLAIIQCATGLAAWRATGWLAGRRPGLPLQKVAGALVGIAGLVFGAIAAF